MDHSTALVPQFESTPPQVVDFWSCVKAPEDDQLGRLLSLVVTLLVLCIAYLVVLLPVALLVTGNADVVAAAIGALATLLGTIVTLRARR